MFNKLVYIAYTVPKSYTDSEFKMKVIDKLVQLCDPRWSVDRSFQYKKFLEAGIITITDGRQIEQHAASDLVLYKLPPVLFSNNKYFTGSYRKCCGATDDPLQLLIRMVQQYYKVIKKQSITFK